ncbi:hypothetical protein GCM10022220_66320 [Actinocatenispora rupis]|uniref:HTH luxR-type domain-containing protein n=2 Tax=Actinocatenispora rupis TaxID=519421 RepID=A0A8J3J597_9ACTN|nr:response regulator transcription factor [Actinocatenispora rupis]GID16076.1 hypothetical protein Aru02nite_69650 [Actinocatenispora rupis]
MTAGGGVGVPHGGTGGYGAAPVGTLPERAYRPVGALPVPARPGPRRYGARSMVVCARDAPEVRGVLARAHWPGTVYTAASGGEALAGLGECPADLVLVDCATVRPSCALFVRQVLDRSPRTTVVVVGADSPYVAAGALAAGARAVICTGLHGAELAAALAHGLRAPHATSLTRVLTGREMQVLRFMSHGLTNAEIGRELYITEDTVKTHARRLYGKLGVRDRAHAVATAFRAGLVS